MARRKSEPPAYQNDMLLVRFNWSVICSDVWVIFYFSIKSPCIVQLRRSCDHFGIAGINSTRTAQEVHSRKSMVATWHIWLYEQSLPLSMKYSRYVYYIICHSKQDAKVIFVGYNNQFSEKSVKWATRNINENLFWKHLDKSKYANCISAGRFSEQCREQRSSDKVPDKSPDTWFNRCSTSEIRCCFHGHMFALGVLDAPNVVVGNERDLLVEVVVMAPVDAQLYMLRHGNSNTTVFVITRLPNSVG